jgi:acetyl esterase/lipase
LAAASRPWVHVDNVSRPTITRFAPQGKNTGAAVVVFPGGGYWLLAIDLEGTEACDWLASRGITAVLLKYRVPGEGKLPKSGAYPNSAEALQDAQRAIGLVRFHAAEWHLVPIMAARVGRVRLSLPQVFLNVIETLEHAVECKEA